MEDEKLLKQLANTAENKGKEKWSAEQMMKRVEEIYKKGKSEGKSLISVSQDIPDMEIANRYMDNIRMNKPQAIQK